MVPVRCCAQVTNLTLKRETGNDVSPAVDHGGGGAGEGLGGGDAIAGQGEQSCCCCRVCGDAQWVGSSCSVECKRNVNAIKSCMISDWGGLVAVVVAEVVVVGVGGGARYHQKTTASAPRAP
jgi:hypothetical protein